MQVALALTPVLVFASLLFATHLTLVFPTLLALVLLIAGILGALVVNDGESTWEEGAVLVGFYVVIAAELLVGHLATPLSVARPSRPSARRDPAARSSICRPRRPALTRIVSHSSAVSSTVVGSRLRWPSGLIPPTT